MVVDDFDIPGISIAPSEADPPLIIDAYAMLPLPGSFQFFEMVPGRNLQVVEAHGGMDLQEFSQGDTLNGRRDAFRSSPVEKGFRVFRTKTQNHSCASRHNA